MPDTWTLHSTGEAPIGDEGSGRIEHGIGRENRRGKVHLGHAIRPWSLVADHHHVARGYLAFHQRIEGHLLKVEHPCRSDMDMHLLGNREGLDHGPTGSQITTQYCDASIRPKGVRTRTENLAPRHLDVVQVADPLGKEPAVLDLLEVLAQSFAGDGEAIQVEQVT